jgi:hypothetical protein
VRETDRRYGAPAPPVGLLAPTPALPLEPFDPEPPPLELPPLEPALELSPPPVPELPVPEEAPPVVLAPALDEPLELSPPVPVVDCSPELDSPELSLEPAELELAVVEVVEVVDVEAVRVASLSADVLLGGTISGVLWGTTSVVLSPPPQALRVRPASRATAIAATGRRPVDDLRPEPGPTPEHRTV